MYRKEELAREFRKCFPDWSDERIEEHAEFLAGKFATLKKGPNIIHLTYYGHLIRPEDLQEMEDQLAKAGLELSHFDRRNAPYSPAPDDDLDFALHLAVPMVQQLLAESDQQVVWAIIKNIALAIWERLKGGHGSQLPANSGKETYSLGLKISLHTHTRLSLKLADNSEEITIIEALDKVIDLIKKEIRSEVAGRLKYFLFDKQKRAWAGIDVTG